MNIFKQKIKVGGIPKNKFDLSHEKKLTLNMGTLVPILKMDVVPGDTFRVSSEIFMRLAPMIAPIMHRVDIYTHYFYVPNRIVWSGFDDFISKEGPTIPQKVPQFLFPATGFPNDGIKSGTLADYFGVPTVEDAAPLASSIAISQLPFRAYQLIFNEYYRDQTLGAEIPVPKDDLDITITTNATVPLMELRQRAWEKDYFTTALPNPQYGAIEAGVPVDIQYLPTSQVFKTDGSSYEFNALVGTNGGSNDLVIDKPAATGGGATGRIENIDPTGSSILINELRKANALQLWLEKQARGGQRLVETVLSHFGVRVPDSRVSRPEYLGGGKQHISISEVLSTFDNTAADFPQGTMAGHGISSGKSHGFTHTFPEHGYVIGIMSVLPKAAYQQGFNRDWLRQTKYDFYWPTFANLGEQEIKNQEIYWDNAFTGDPDGTFGYQMRYAEYKYQPDTVHGDFRSNLAYWHLGRIFTAAPVLNEDFITAKTTDFDRIFAVTDPTVHKLWCQVYNSVDALRPMPVFGTPRL